MTQLKDIKPGTMILVPIFGPMKVHSNEDFEDAFDKKVPEGKVALSKDNLEDKTVEWYLADASATAVFKQRGPQ